MIYEPSDDSFLLAKELKKICKNKRVLDLGTGSGYLAEIAIKNKVSYVLAVDTNIEAIKKLKEKGINAKVSNLFSNVNEKFDLIVFNPPYLPLDKNEDLESKRITTGGKKGYELLEKFFSQAKNYLNKNGKILIVFSSLTGDVDSIIKKYNFKFKLLNKKKLFFEELYVYLISFYN